MPAHLNMYLNESRGGAVVVAGTLVHACPALAAPAETTP